MNSNKIVRLICKNCKEKFWERKMVSSPDGIGDMCEKCYNNYQRNRVNKKN